ncbi:MAG: homocysteine S-methyltransferase family protein [Caldilineaceae bacterium]|nr:homocysteine S-methyltransferase family protein [Caldilineaceae bacterium]
MRQLRTQPLLADGAMGTMLYARGVAVGHCLEQLVIDRPEWVMEIHLAYANAGADLITSHTFGANRLRLAHYGLENRVAELNAAAMRLALDVRERAARAFEHKVYVAGNVGPVGRRVEWADPLQQRVVVDAYREQIGLLAEAGTDLLLFETFSDLVELEVAVQAAKELCNLPLVASMSYGADGRTLAGQDAARVTTRLLASGVDVVGVNCSTGPAQVMAALREMQRAAPDGMFSAMSNAGLPERVGDRLQYPIGPNEFAGYVPPYLKLGVRIVGGCCGTTPAHVAAMREALDGHLALKE